MKLVMKFIDQWNISNRNYLILCGSLVLAGILLLCYHVLAGMVHAWSAEDQYSYAPIVLIVFGYLLWISWPSLLKKKIDPNGYGIILVLFGFMLFMTGAFGLYGFLARFSCICLLTGCIICLAGLEIFKELIFPIFTLLFMIPLPEFVDFYFSGKLRLISSSLSEKLMQMMGMSVFREGNIIDLGTMKLDVAYACSGMNYLLPMVFLAILMGHFYLKKHYAKILLIFSAIPISMGINVLRITAVGILSTYWTVEFSEGFLHYFSGWFIFAVGFMSNFIVLLLIIKVFDDKSSYSVKALIPSKMSCDVFLEEKIKCNISPVLSIFCLFVIFILIYHAILYKKKDKFYPHISKLPYSISGYKGDDIPVDPYVTKASSVTDSLTRIYRIDAFSPVFVYIGYYRTSPDLDGFFHTPSVCLGSTGWEVETVEDHRLHATENNGPINARLVLSKNTSSHMAMIYWYNIGGWSSGNERITQLYTGYNAIFGDYNDAVKVMISTEYLMKTGADAAKKRLEKFINDFLPYYYKDVLKFL